MSARLRRFVAVAAVAVTALTVAPAAAFGHKPGHAETPRPTSPVPGFVLDRGRYTSIQVPGATGESLAGGINNRGQIVGQYRDARGEHGYRSDAEGKLTTIDIPGALATAPVKINDRGQIVGIYSRNATNTKDPDATFHGFVLQRGKVTTIDYPGAASTQAAGINNRGEVVGDYFDAAGTAHGFRWYKGRFTRIDVPGTFTGVLDINDRGQIVGYHADNVAGPFHGFLVDGASSRRSTPRGSGTRTPPGSTTVAASWVSPARTLRGPSSTASASTSSAGAHSSGSTSQARPAPSPATSTTGAGSSASTRTPTPAPTPAPTGRPAESRATRRCAAARSSKPPSTQRTSARGGRSTLKPRAVQVRRRPHRERNLGECFGARSSYPRRRLARRHQPAWVTCRLCPCPARYAWTGVPAPGRRPANRLVCRSVRSTRRSRRPSQRRTAGGAREPTTGTPTT